MRNSISILLAIVVIATGCSDPEPEPESVPLGDLLATPDSAVTYRGTGVVLSIAQEKTRMVVRHDQIGEFMSAMTMPFALVDSTVAESVATGDSIAFDLSVRGAQVEITRVEVIQ